MITEINESKIITNMYQVNININIMVVNSIKRAINTNVSVKSKEHHACEKDYT